MEWLRMSGVKLYLCSLLIGVPCLIHALSNPPLVMSLARLQHAARRTAAQAARTVAPARWSSSSAQPSTPAIAFDIDGVLLRGRQLLPTARTALKKVTRKADGGSHPVGIPHIYLTNGGGMTEAAKAKQLSDLFDVHIPTESIVLSHTPMQHLLPQYKDELVLVVGHSRCGVRSVAANYGFKHLLIPEGEEFEAQIKWRGGGSTEKASARVWLMRIHDRHVLFFFFLRADIMHKYPHSVPHLTYVLRGLSFHRRIASPYPSQWG